MQKVLPASIKGIQINVNKARSKIDPKTEKQIKQIHNQIYVQQCVDDISTVIMRYLHEEKVQLQNPILIFQLM